MAGLYSSIPALRTETGVEPDHLGFDTDEELNAWLTLKLEAARDYINDHMERDYAEEADEGHIERIPGSIHQIALEIASNMVVIARLKRASDTVNLSDYEAKLINTGPFTTSVNTALGNLPRESQEEQSQDARAGGFGSLSISSQFRRPYPPGWPIANRDDEWAFED